MPHRSDPETLVLTGLRLTSVAPVERVAAAVGLPVDTAGAVVASLTDRGFVEHRAGVLSGWQLTVAGRRQGEQRLTAELDETGLRPVVTDAYHRFRALNSELLAACTDWQLRLVDSQLTTNDHVDGAHDAAAVARLAAVDDAIQPVCDELSAALERFTRYGRRLAVARRRVEAGEGDWFTRLTIDSYHTVWFELHEHLLASLGLERAGEHDDPRQEAS